MGQGVEAARPWMAMVAALGRLWGARWWKGEGRPWVGASGGWCGGAHLERNQTKMAWARRSTTLCSSARGGRRVRSVAGVHGDKLRMVRGITVQHPAQFIGGQRRFVARKISAGELRAAMTAQRRRGVPRLAGRFDLQWGHGSDVDFGGHRRAARATRAGRPASKAAAEWGHDVGRHGVVPGATCGPVAGRKRQASLVCELVRGVDSAAVRACVCCKDCLAVNYITPLIKIVLLYHFALPV